MSQLSDEWQRERSMSPKAFERAVRSLGISQSAAGRFLGVSESSIRRYLTGDTEVPVSVVLLLRLMNELGVQADFVPRRLRKESKEPPTAQP
jgi:transcriptional regulator with XRE-family HTH domain